MKRIGGYELEKFMETHRVVCRTCNIGETFIADYGSIIILDEIIYYSYMCDECGESSTTEYPIDSYDFVQNNYKKAKKHIPAKPGNTEPGELPE